MTQIVTGDLTDEFAAEFARVGIGAWDTETSGLDWRIETLQLCQISHPEVGTVLIRVTDEPPARLIGLLSDPDVVKVFHHAPFDLRFMRRAWDVSAVNVHCTKVASKLLAPRIPANEHSLRSLMRRYLGIALEKGDVRTSDWGAPELSPDQVAYAEADVEHLLALYQGLRVDLAVEGLSDLYEACCAYLPAQADVQMRGISDVFVY